MYLNLQDLYEDVNIVSGFICFTFSFQNNDGKLTKDEFREGSKCDPWIVEALTTPHR